MNKRILLFAAFALLLLTGCHGKKSLPEFNVPEELDESKTYEISFWAKNDTNKTQTEIYQKAIEDFEKLYPNIHVNVRMYSDYGKIYNDVITNISTGTPPNVCITYPDHIATYMTGTNVVVPLDELFDDERYGLGGSALKFDGPTRDEIKDKFLKECMLGGHYYAVPYVRSTEALYMNKDMIEELGYEIPDEITWDFVWEVSETAMATDSDGNFKINGQKVMIPFIYKSTDNMMIQMLRQLNAGYCTPEGEVLLFNDDTREILKKVAKHAEDRSFSTFKISSYPGNFLNAGQCIFAIDSTAGATWMGAKAVHADIPEDQFVDFEILVRPIPQYDSANQQMISQGPSLCIFNKEDPDEVLASWLFAQFMLTNEVQIAYSSTEGYLPVTDKALNSPEYQDYLARAGEDNDYYYKVKIDAARVLLDNIDKTFTAPPFNGSTSLRNAAGELIEGAAKAARRGKTVDDAYIDGLFEDTKALYRLDRNIVSTIDGKRTDSPLPTASVALISILVGTWVLIGAYFLYKTIKNQKS
ncbi:MAG: extracellular solute-binding protein [Lachnospiraceae bacterium]|nr:extracellular solute-binding protein [Lachnospiraceae bacterium]